MTSNILLDLSHFLNETNLFKLIFPLIDEYLRYTFKTNEELKNAVSIWLEDEDKALKKYGHISFWNTKFITEMNCLFEDAKSFNEILYWDTKNVSNMSRMFCFAESFNQPLNFNTKNVSNMSRMFMNASSFNQPLNFNTKNVYNMSFMFSGAESFNKPFNFTSTKNVTDMS